MKKFFTLLIGLILVNPASANYSADLISVESIRVKENGDFIVKPSTCHSGPCTCSDYWVDEGYGVSTDSKQMQMSLLLAAHMADKKVYIYYNSTDGQCRQKQTLITNN